MVVRIFDTTVGTPFILCKLSIVFFEDNFFHLSFVFKYANEMDSFLVSLDLDNVFNIEHPLNQSVLPALYYISNFAFTFDKFILYGAICFGRLP